MKTKQATQDTQDIQNNWKPRTVSIALCHKCGHTWLAETCPFTSMGFVGPSGIIFQDKPPEGPCRYCGHTEEGFNISIPRIYAGQKDFDKQWQELKNKVAQCDCTNCKTVRSVAA